METPLWSDAAAELFTHVAMAHLGIIGKRIPIPEIAPGSSAWVRWEDWIVEIARGLFVMRAEQAAGGKLPYKITRAKMTIEVVAVWIQFWREVIPVEDLELAARHQKFLDELWTVSDGREQLRRTYSVENLKQIHTIADRERNAGDHR